MIGSLRPLVLALAAGAALVPIHGRTVDRTVDPRESVHPGWFEEFRITSRHDGRSRRVWVYTPPNDPTRADSAGLLITFDGEEYFNQIPLPLILDTLIASGRVPPMMAVLIDDSTSTARLADLANRAGFADFLAHQLMPWVRSHWQVTRDPHRVIVTGSSAGGLAAAYVALRHPGLFGNVLSQSGAFWRGNEASNDPPWEWVTGQVRDRPKRDVRFWMEVGSTESRGALGGSAPSILEANRKLRDALAAKGYDVTYVEVPNGVHAPETWRTRLPIGLEGLAAPDTAAKGTHPARR